MRIPAFGSLAALNDWLADQCVRLWQQTRHPELDMTLWEAWSLERPYLMPVGQPFDGFVEHTERRRTRGADHLAAGAGSARRTAGQRRPL